MSDLSSVAPIAVIQETLIQAEEKEQVKDDDMSFNLTQEVFEHLKSQGIILPEDLNHSELDQRFKEVNAISKRRLYISK